MKTYARIAEGMVAELFSTNSDIAAMFHPDLIWVECDGTVEQGWLYNGSTFSAPPVPPVPIPQRVSAAQGGIALINAGLMDAVQAAVDAADTPASVKWAWTHAQDWERPSLALAYLAEKAGITDAQMDDLFVAAAQITA